MVTDPPYGIELDSEWRDRAGLNGHGPAEPSNMKKRTVGHTETTISGDTRADWSEAFELAPSLEVAYVWHASKFTREVLDGLLRIGFIQGELRVGNRDIAALCLALLDWSTELRILQNEKRRQAGTRRREGDGIASAQELTE